jgi:hypothetical protein
MICDRNCRTVCQRINLRELLLLLLSRLGEIRFRGLRRGWNATEILLDHCQSFFRFKISYDRDGGIVGGVKRLEELLNVPERRRIEVF